MDNLFFKVFRNKILFDLIFNSIKENNKERFNRRRAMKYKYIFSVEWMLSNDLVNLFLDKFKRAKRLQERFSLSYSKRSLELICLKINDYDQFLEIYYELGAYMFNLDFKCLCEAIEGGNLEIVKFLLRESKFELSEAYNAFTSACGSGNLEMIEYVYQEIKDKSKIKWSSSIYSLNRSGHLSFYTQHNTLNEYDIHYLKVLCINLDLDAIRYLLSEKSASFEKKHIRESMVNVITSKIKDVELKLRCLDELLPYIDRESKWVSCLLPRNMEIPILEYLMERSPPVETLSTILNVLLYGWIGSHRDEDTDYICSAIKIAVRTKANLLGELNEYHRSYGDPLPILKTLYEELTPLGLVVFFTNESSPLPLETLKWMVSVGINLEFLENHYFNSILVMKYLFQNFPEIRDLHFYAEPWDKLTREDIDYCFEDNGFEAYFSDTQLISAVIEKGKSDLTKYLLEKYVQPESDLYASLSNYITICKAVESNDLDVVKLVINHFPNVPLDRGIASLARTTEILDYFINEKGIQPNCSPSLVYHIGRGDLGLVKLIVENHTGPLDVKYIETSIHSNEISILQYLVETQGIPRSVNLTKLDQRPQIKYYLDSLQKS